MVILGIDPGLASTGYGLIDTLGEAMPGWSAPLRLIAAGDIRPPRTQPLAQRLAVIHDTLAQLIVRHRPEAAVLEKLFTHARHVTTATMMGHARGVACLVVQEHGLRLAEYPVTHVKKSLVGNGHASKDQIARMVGHWLQQQDEGWSSDASDALALAIVHAHLTAQQQNLQVTFQG